MCSSDLLGCVTAIALFLPSFTTSVQAQAAYPPLHDPYVNDYGAVLAADDKANMRAQLEAFRAQTGIHAVVMTIQSIHDYATGDTSIESFATNTFNTWGLGDVTRNDGILLLVAPGDREVRIELGSGYSANYDRVAQSIIDDAMLPRFRDNQISRGTVAGAEAIVQRFDPNRSQLQTIADRVPTLDSSSHPAWLLTLLAPLGAMLGIFRQWRRHRVRDCPQCRIEMRRLSETEDDRYLEAGQRREESLKSVDYDVWLCPDCGHHKVLAYGSWFSSYSKCPACRHKTMSTQSQTITPATYDHSGEAKVTETCRHCDRVHSYRKTLPRRQRSSSSSSSSGGGRSSGGGASGSW